MKPYQAIETVEAPKAIGTYSQAVIVDEWVYLSGQIGLDPNTQELVIGFEAQCRQILDNMAAVLKAAGCDTNHLIKCGIFVTDLSDFSRLNAIMAEYFSPPYPARSVVAVSALPKGALVEIEAVAKR